MCVCVCVCLPPGSIRHEVLCILGIKFRRGNTLAETCVLLVNAGQRIPRCNINFVKSPGTKPGDLAGHRFPKPENLEQCEFMLVIACTYFWWLDAIPE